MAYFVEEGRSVIGKKGRVFGPGDAITKEDLGHKDEKTLKEFCDKEILTTKSGGGSNPGGGRGKKKKDDPAPQESGGGSNPGGNDD